MKPTTLILLFITTCILGCNQPTSSDYTTPLEAKKTTDGIGYTLSIPKAVYALSDTLQLSFRVQNESNRLKEFGFANQQQFGFQLTDASGTIALSYPSIFLPAGSGFVLRPGESKLFSTSWLFKNHNGNFINRSDYRLSGYLTEGKSPAVSLQISVK